MVYSIIINSALSHCQKCPGLANILYGPLSPISGSYYENHRYNDSLLSSLFCQKASCMFPATENPKNLSFLWVIINILRSTLAHSQQFAKVPGAVHGLNFRNRASGRRSLQVGWMRLQTRAQEKTTLTHSETQLPLYCSMTAVHNCPCAPGLVGLWHTPRMAPRLMGNMIWATHFPGHVFPTITKTKHFSPRNV